MKIVLGFRGFFLTALLLGTVVNGPLIAWPYKINYQDNYRVFKNVMKLADSENITDEVSSQLFDSASCDPCDLI